MPFSANHRALIVGIALASGVVPAAAQQARLRAEWTDNALQYRDQVDRRVTLVCPSEGKPSKVYGTDVYTVDSSVCTAAAHASVIETGKGGAVTIVIGRGADSYEGSTRNGIASGKFGEFAASFVFERENAPGTIDWATTGIGLNFVDGPLDLVCPPGGNARRVWGTDIYTEDSSICTAAVHTGAITTSKGGTIRIEYGGSQESYAPSERNGITSQSWRSWPHSFTIVVASVEITPQRPAPAPPPAPPPPASAPLVVTQNVSAPSLSITGVFTRLTAPQSLTTPALSIAGVVVPLATTRTITPPPLAIRGRCAATPSQGQLIC